jgi:hypothetical protein
MNIECQAVFLKLLYIMKGECGPGAGDEPPASRGIL